MLYSKSLNQLYNLTRNTGKEKKIHKSALKTYIEREKKRFHQMILLKEGRVSCSH